MATSGFGFQPGSSVATSLSGVAVSNPSSSATTTASTSVVTSSGAVAPGLCGSEGCPPPTTIECIQVPKVYDFCFQAETFPNVCTSTDGCVVESGATTSCAITSTTCSFVSSTQIDTTDFYNVTFAITVRATVTITNPNGSTCTVTDTLSFTKTVTLCAPVGTVQSCEVAGAVCGPCVIVGYTVCCNISLCLVFLSTATVALLVPSYGFCTPTACVVAAAPPCPPIFPTSCLLTSSSSQSSAGSSTGTSFSPRVV